LPLRYIIELQANPDVFPHKIRAQAERRFHDGLAAYF
jgi:hypothetical protein